MTSPRRTLRITVLRGGPGPEREISLASGAAVAAALRARSHHVYESDIGPEDLAALHHPADVIFPALHGPFGEDGTLQRICEERNLRFVGSGSAASALAMDKIAAKQRVQALGCLTPASETWTAETLEAQKAAALAPPLVIKPADQGSSVDTFILTQPAEIAAAIRQVVTHFGRALVEQFIRGDEFTVGIVGEQTLPPIWVKPARGFYDYSAKYQVDDTEYIFDSHHPPALHALLAEQSLAVFRTLGCRHLARIDWIVDAAGRPWFLEVNTIPGFTSHSLVPKAAARVGISFEELTERLAFLALEPNP